MTTYMNQTNSGRIIVKQTNPTAIIVQPDNERKIILKGTGGLKGEKGDAATITVGSTTTGEPGTQASVVNSGTSTDAVLDFTIPKGSKGDKGDKGDTGTAATVSAGTTTTLPAGSSASVTNSGTSSAAIFDFSIPKGDKGDKGDTGATGSAATVSAGTTTTLPEGSSASVTNSGTSSAAVFDFSIPKGDKGDKGDTGATGSAATIAVGATSTLTPGSSATVTNSGTSSAAVFDFGIPKGEKGDTGATGPANTLSIGTVQGGATAAATITGTAPNQTLNLTLPKGDKGDTGATGSTGPAGADGYSPTATVSKSGDTATITITDKNGTTTASVTDGADGAAGAAATIVVGTTSTLPAGSSATVTNSGTSSAAVFDFGIPKGDKGDTGSQGPAGQGVVIGGTTGQVLAKKSNTNYDTEWVTPTSYSDFTGATSSVAGAHGLVPAPTTSDPDKFLKGDGTWGTPPGTTYTAGTGIDITGSSIAVDTSTVAMQTDLPTKTSDLLNDGADNTSTYVEADELATVATSGSYNDLSNKPTIPTINRFTKSLYNSTANSWYYPIATLPIDNSGNYCSVIVDGRIGGWVDSNMAKLDLIFTNRDGYTGDTVAAAGSIKGAYSNALNLCDVVVYKQTDKSAIAYLKCDGYFTFDVEVKYFQATSAWTGNYTTTPSGTLIWSTKTTNSLEYVDQAGKISKVREVYNHFTSRPASANLTATGNGGMFTFQATNAMTTGKPKSDSSILQLEWDNTGGHDTQLAMCPGIQGSWLAHRHQNSGTWGNWIYTLDDVAGSVKTTNIDALAVTTAKIADGAITEAKMDATDWAKKVNVASIDLSNQTTTLLSLTKALGTAGTDYARWTAKYDGASSGISDKPTGGTNASFVCEARCSRWASNVDYRYQLICWVQQDTNPYVAYVADNTSAISWSRLKPTVNDATLTITQNGSTLGTFTANASSNVTIDVPGGGGGSPTGSISMFAGSSAPTGYLLCDGSAVSRTTYADLFTVIGTTYGTGDGSTTFNLPNLKGRVPVGRDANDTSFDVLGETGGEKSHKLVVSEMPKHTHRLSCQRGTPGNSSWDYAQPGTGWNASAWNPNPTEPIGGDGYHNNLQPYIVLNYIIKI